MGLRAGMDWCGKFRPTGIRSPDRPARRQSLYRLHYPAHKPSMYRVNIFKRTYKIAVKICGSWCLSGFLGAFAKLRIATISVVFSVRPTVGPHAPIRFRLDRFS